MILKSLILLALAVTPQQTVEDIAKVPRPTGSEQCMIVRDHIINNLKSNGYNPEIQKFGYRSMQVENITVIIDTPDTSNAIAIGAHYDSVSRSPGADDNASGTAAILELAKRFKNKRFKYDVIFILFSGEEQGLVGSAYWAKYHPRSKDVEFMINLDMIGHLKEIGSRYNDTPNNVNEILAELYQKYPFASNITYRNGHDGGSDHASFSCPTIFLHTGLHGMYHRPSDLPNTLNYAGLDSIINYCESLVMKIAEEKADNVDYDDLIWNLPIMSKEK